MPLIPCARCARHVRAHEARCPFCPSSPWLPSAAALTLGAAAVFVACNEAQPPPTSQADVASIGPLDAAAIAPVDALALPDSDAAAVALPDAAPSAAPPAAPCDSPGLGADCPPNGGMTNAVYGGPPPGWGSSPRDSGAPVTTGIVSIAPLSTTAPIPDVVAVITWEQLGLRACYNAGLREDPTQSGKVVLSVKVSPTGDVTDVQVVKNSGLAANTARCMASRLRNASFSAPGGSGSVLTIHMTCLQK